MACKINQFKPIFKKNFLILIKGMHMPFIATIDNIFIKKL